ncbi:MAG: zinc ribbon domain-containing protein [Deltaproteobacteria bacterium]|nr:zinc ribbon domain-containing protein [Deltaproteobacteria bacterium]
MPIYEYECQKCQKVTEAWQSLSDEPLTSCPDCQGSLKKLISSSSFQLKGGGWYADGYCNSKQGKCESGSAAPSSPCNKESASCPCAAS